MRSPHPDPDMLAAFADGAIGNQERKDLLIHFAECPTCRECLCFMTEAEVPANDTGRRRFQFAPLPAVAAAVFACVIATGLWQLRPVKLAAGRNQQTAAQKVRRSYNFRHVSLASIRPPVPPRFIWISVLPMDLKPQADQIVVNSHNGERWITFERPWSAIDVSGVEPAGTAN